MPYSTLCYLELTKCVGYTNSFCYCQTTSLAQVFDVVINITADTSLSEAKVKGAMEIHDMRIDSVEKSIPKIYDGEKIQVNMAVNGIVRNASNCDMDITGNDVYIAIEIPDIVNLQYQIVLKNVRTNMVLRNESKSLFYKTQVMDTLQLAVYFQVYDLPVSQQFFQCFIQANDPDVTDNTFTVLFAIAVAILVMIVLLIFVYIKRKKRILSHNKFKKSKKDDSFSEYENEVELQQIRVPLQGQKDENADVMTCSRSTVSDELHDIIPEHIIAKIKEVKGKKVNKRNPVVKLSEIHYESIIKSKYDILNHIAKIQLETMVSVDVEVVSNRRPKTWPGTKVPYPLSGRRKLKRKGFGRIISVNKCTTHNREKSHLWRRSFHYKSKDESREWLEVLVYVSRHLVFDDLEAKHTTCKFIINTGRTKTLQFQGAIVRMTNVEENWTLLTCFSKDVSIYYNLQDNLKNFNQMWFGLDISNVISFIVYCRDMTLKKTNFADLFYMFSEDKTLSFCLNTFCEEQNMAIFFERASGNLMRMYQMKVDFGKYYDSDVYDDDSQLKLSSMPFIVENVQHDKNIKVHI